jgi:hypothetical protein
VGNAAPSPPILFQPPAAVVVDVLHGAVGAHHGPMPPPDLVPCRPAPSAAAPTPGCSPAHQLWPESPSTGNRCPCASPSGYAAEGGRAGNAAARIEALVGSLGWPSWGNASRVLSRARIWNQSNLAKTSDIHRFFRPLTRGNAQQRQGRLLLGSGEGFEDSPVSKLRCRRRLCRRNF